ncbi:hypothetical protein SASPL_100130 [Salvia splendens]|uniref:Large ribosomal subunit protein uL6 N-terminal domain-containing protein n=1 Tax=Salvia splendens TaxID=180675 RepID=A0A8X8YSA4_SALSN|nr:hypothetical protein SASPL_100130 [Salvia splendens]
MAPKQKARNPELIPGVRKVSRSKMYHKRGLWAIKAKNGGKFPVHAKQEAAASVVEEKQPKFYPADDVKKPLSNKRKPKPTKLRASVTPGTVLIILTGRVLLLVGRLIRFLLLSFKHALKLILRSELFASFLIYSSNLSAIFKFLCCPSNLSPSADSIHFGRLFISWTVVFSYPISFGCGFSQLLIWNCPYKVNGVPLRRVNQAYVIGTSTKVDISGVDVSKFDDKYFGKQVEKKKKKGETEFFEADKQEKNTLPAEKKDDQKAVDAPLLKALESVPDLKAYLGARFSLKAGMKPHELVF